MDVQFGDILRSIRIGRGLSQEEFAKILGTTKQVISRYETNQRTPKITTADEYARILGVPLQKLIGQSSAPSIPPGFEPLPEMNRVPLVGNIACGTPILAEQNIEDRVGIPAEWHADFVLRCRGDSMAPVIQDGDLVAIRQQPEVENGQIAAVRIENEATLKRVYLNASQLRLVPVNPDYDPIFLVGEEMNTAHIEGLAVGLCRGL